MHVGNDTKRVGFIAKVIKKVIKVIKSHPQKPSKIKGFRVSCRGSIPARSTKKQGV